MGDKANAHPGAAGRAAAADHPASVRNVVLVGHSGSGKTTLVEALALTAGAVNRAGRVEDGGTVSDYDEIEHRQQRSVQLSLVPVEWGGIKINLLDTPGYADFVGELRAGLRAADAALFVVSAGGRRRRRDPHGVGRVRGGRHAARHRRHPPGGRPRRLRGDDRGSAGRPSAATTPTPCCRSTCRCTAPQGPTGTRPVTGLIGLLSQRVFDYSSGERKERDPRRRRSCR